ncbi:MAG: dienelactone hydrolase family protein [Longimicrobiales bacterium]|nr:dienelactone hydrolase family protein [Longimicrobiales bacterium]
MRTSHTPSATILLLCLLGFTACSGSPEGATRDGTTRDGATQAGATGAAAAAAFTGQEPRVALSPTAAGELPDAIVGEGDALQGFDLTYFDADPQTKGYLAVPEGEGPFPALVIVHEWNGLVDRIRQVADDFAAEGYVTLAADLYSGRTGTTPGENRALVEEVQSDQATMIANLNAAVRYLESRPDVSGRIGAMGWCFGGGVALSFGLDGDNHEATAIFYGRLVDDPDRLAHLSHEVYGTFAALDQGIPPSAVTSFEAALREVGIENDLHIYDDVQHGFWLRVDQDPDALTAPALDAWERLKAYLNRTLGS